MSNIGSAAIRLCTQLLEMYGDAPLEIERGDASMVVKPADPKGFEITLYSVGEDAMVSAERWHTHYEDPKQAAFCLLWLLTPYYRIAHELKDRVKSFRSRTDYQGGDENVHPIRHSGCAE